MAIPKTLSRRVRITQFITVFHFFAVQLEHKS